MSPLTSIDLLTKGFLPKELPSSFSTGAFARAWTGGGKSAQCNNSAFKCVEFNFSRPGKNLRTLSIPHPKAQGDICEAISSNWIDITKLLRSNKLSITVPTVRQGSLRAIARSHPYSHRAIRRAEIRSCAKYIAQSDVMGFYSSIYTHVIPWSIEGKDIAKAQRSNRNLFGNSLDRKIQACRDGQTKGIPIGPDSSFLIGEIILSQVDKLISSKSGFRYVDDYEFACSSHAEAEEILGSLHSGLRRFELEPNSHKESVIKLPDALFDSSRWTQPINRLLEIDYRRSSGQKQGLLHLFDRSFVLAKENPEHSVLNYTLAGILRQIKLNKLTHSSCQLLSSLILQCTGNEYWSIRTAVEILVRMSKMNIHIERDELSNLLSSKIESDIVRSYHCEVAWSVWAAIIFECPLSRSASKLLSKSDNSVLNILTLDARARNLLPRNFDTKRLEKKMTASELYGSNWLFAYEADIKGWLSSQDSKNHVESDPFFKYLKKNGVSFYESQTLSEALAENAEEVFYV